MSPYNLRSTPVRLRGAFVSSGPNNIAAAMKERNRDLLIQLACTYVICGLMTWQAYEAYKEYQDVGWDDMRGSRKMAMWCFPFVPAVLFFGRTALVLDAYGFI